MKLRLLTVAMLATIPLAAQAGGIERATQSVEPIFEKGNYAEISYAWVDPDIKGEVTNPQFAALFGKEIKDVSESYGMLGAAVKIAPSENTTLAVLYDEPWGVDTVYPQGNLFANRLGATTAKVDTQSLTTIAGFKTDSNFWFYGGLEWQQAEGQVKGAQPIGGHAAEIQQVAAYRIKIDHPEYTSAQVAGAVPAYLKNPANLSSIVVLPRLYSLDIEKTDTVVPVVGVAYEVPDIALRAALTYRAPAKHRATTKETVSVNGRVLPQYDSQSGTIQFEFPQSVNLDFQTGIMADTLLMANLRWVNWENFDIRPGLYTALEQGKSLASYAEDQISVSLGVGRRFTDKFSAQVSAGYDTGTGEPYTLLGPYAETTDVGVGVKYAFTPNVDVSVGAKYLWLGDATKVENAADFTDNTGVAVGAKVGFHF